MTKTSNVKNAGDVAFCVTHFGHIVKWIFIISDTDDQIVVKILSGSRSCEVRLDNPKRNDFERGQIDRFPGTMLGNCRNFIFNANSAYSVEIKHTGTNGWKPEYIG